MPGHKREDCTHKAADYDPWVAECREALNLPGPSPDDPLIHSQFRRHMGMPLVTHGWARSEARRQVEEIRQSSVRLENSEP